MLSTIFCIKCLLRMSLFTSVNIFLSFTLLTVHSTAPHKFTSKKQIFEVCFLEVLFIFRDDFINLDDNKPASFIFHNNFSIKPSSAAEKSTSVPSSRFLLTPPSSGTHYSSLYRIQVRVFIYSTPGTLYTRLYRIQVRVQIYSSPDTHYSRLYRIQVKVLIYSSTGTLYNSLYRIQGRVPNIFYSRYPIQQPIYRIQVTVPNIFYSMYILQQPIQDTG